MKKAKGKATVNVPSDITAVFLFSHREDAEKAHIALKHKGPEEEDIFLVSADMKIVYRKDVWDVVET